MSSDRALVRPQLFCHGLADDDDGRRIGCVTGADVPALEQRDVHGLDISWRRDADRHLGLFGHCDQGMPFSGNGLIGAANQRQIVYRSSRLNAGQGAHALQHLRRRTVILA